MSNRTKFSTAAELYRKCFKFLMRFDLQFSKTVLTVTERLEEIKKVVSQTKTSLVYKQDFFLVSQNYIKGPIAIN